MYIQVKDSSVCETWKNTDVLVAGGGPAGVAAAYAAASQGCEVVLIEKYGFLGGYKQGNIQ